jgi:hypothetical protein
LGDVSPSFKQVEQMVNLWTKTVSPALRCNCLTQPFHAFKQRCVMTYPLILYKHIGAGASSLI